MVGKRLSVSLVGYSIFFPESRLSDVLDLESDVCFLGTGNDIICQNSDIIEIVENNVSIVFASTVSSD